MQTIREGNKKEVRDERGEEKDIVGSSNGSLQERPTSWIRWAAERAIIHQQDWKTITYLGGRVKSERGEGVGSCKVRSFFDVSCFWRQEGYTYILLCFMLSLSLVVSLWLVHCA